MATKSIIINGQTYTGYTNVKLYDNSVDRNVMYPKTLLSDILDVPGATVASKIVVLNDQNKVPSEYLPAYVDDVIELLKIIDNSGTPPTPVYSSDPGLNTHYYNDESKLIFTAKLDGETAVWDDGATPTKGVIYVNTDTTETVVSRLAGAYRWTGTQLSRIEAGVATTQVVGATASQCSTTLVPSEKAVRVALDEIVAGVNKTVVDGGSAATKYIDVTSDVSGTTTTYHTVLNTGTLDDNYTINKAGDGLSWDSTDKQLDIAFIAEVTNADKAISVKLSGATSTIAIASATVNALSAADVAKVADYTVKNLIGSSDGSIHAGDAIDATLIAGGTVSVLYDASSILKNSDGKLYVSTGDGYGTEATGVCFTVTGAKALYAELKGMIEAITATAPITYTDSTIALTIASTSLEVSSNALAVKLVGTGTQANIEATANGLQVKKATNALFGAMRIATADEANAIITGGSTGESEGEIVFTGSQVRTMLASLITYEDC